MIAYTKKNGSMFVHKTCSLMVPMPLYQCDMHLHCVKTSKSV